MMVAISTTKIPMLFEGGFWKMAHEARTDSSWQARASYCPLSPSRLSSRQLDNIFTHRFNVIDRMFSPANGGPMSQDRNLLIGKEHL